MCLRVDYRIHLRACVCARERSLLFAAYSSRCCFIQTHIQQRNEFRNAFGLCHWQDKRTPHYVKYVRVSDFYAFIERIRSKMVMRMMTVSRMFALCVRVCGIDWRRESTRRLKCVGADAHHMEFDVRTRRFRLHVSVSVAVPHTLQIHARDATPTDDTSIPMRMYRNTCCVPQV